MILVSSNHIKYNLFAPLSEAAPGRKKIQARGSTGSSPNKTTKTDLKNLKCTYKITNKKHPNSSSSFLGENTISILNS